MGRPAVPAARQIIDDPELIDLLDEIRGGIGCHQEVEIREVPDLTARPRRAGGVR